MMKRILAAVTLALSASCSYAAEEPITVQGMYVGEGWKLSSHAMTRACFG
ncbi:hypothetical protein PCI56_22595 [Plesiomonas shigelloides subsp. oncorhynchi]|nr:hypothetical protein [Plesiomonas shigelloides]